VWLANELNRGYYGWKYRGNVVIQFSDGSRSLYNPTLNPATIAVQYALSRAGTPYSTWEQQVSIAGLYGVYVQYFGDPFADATDPLVPPTIQQPVLDLPFEDGVEWRFTGGSHGGWGSGSAWSSVDFAPSEERPQSTFCYVSSAWVTAVARGVIARVEDGVIVLDLDGDGDEATGWTVNYLHVTVDESIRAGMTVLPGQRLGNPSCEGGVSNATHLHIGRRFNGEWLPADCQQCLTNVNIPPFVMGGWEVIGIAGQEYQGYMQKGGERIQAEQGIATDINRISG
jgi:LasA protease